MPGRLKRRNAAPSPEYIAKNLVGTNVADKPAHEAEEEFNTTAGCDDPTQIDKFVERARKLGLTEKRIAWYIDSRSNEFIANAQKLGWTDEHIALSIESRKKETRLWMAIENASLIWVRQNEHWKAANVKAYNCHDRTWDVVYLGDAAVSHKYRDFEIDLDGEMR